eukprot:COSAG06_NODE_7098_length_2635_cov_2.976341_3_plen_76_part_00
MRSVYQDRLGTNIGKALKNRPFSQADALGLSAAKVQVFPVSARGALLTKEAEQKGEGGFISPVRGTACSHFLSRA